ncbi:hypothetical protein FRB99_000849 [Tulasnella sp. 403]|nr:hypothetical protein FRB99_000849 [Tulasnella sp. 403]
MYRPSSQSGIQRDEPQGRTDFELSTGSATDRALDHDIPVEAVARFNGISLPNCSDKKIARREPSISPTHALHGESKAGSRAPYSTRNNYIPPLYRLPPEIFGKILYMALVNTDHTTWHRGRLCRVGRAWYRVIRSTPDLWTFIDDRDPVKSVEESLRLSGDLTLRIKSVIGGWWKHGDLDLLLGESRRWGSLDLCDYVLENGPYTAPFLTSTMPNLTRLRIVGSPTVSYVLGDIPHLRHLELQGVSMDWGTTRLSRLVSLTLVDILQPPSISRLVEVLEASPQIEVVDFRHWPHRTLEPVLPTIPTLPSLVFPQLSLLQLFAVPIDYILAIVKHIQAPQCCKFIIETISVPNCGLFEGIDSGFASLVRRLLLSSSAAGQHLEVILDEDCLRFATNKLPPVGGEFALHLRQERLDLQHSFQAVSAFITQLDSKIPTSILIRKWYYPYDSVLFPVLDLFSPTLTKLVINGDYQPLMEYLAQPRMEPGGTYTWPCPMLQTLHFFSTSPSTGQLDGDVVLAFLSGRWGRANVPQEAQHLSHPQRLNYLCLDSWSTTSATVQAIHEAEGGFFNLKFWDNSKIVSFWYDPSTAK